MGVEREGSQWLCLQESDVLLADAGQRARSYLSTIRDRLVAPSPAALAAPGRFGFPLPSEGLDPAAVLRMIDEADSPRLGLVGALPEGLPSSGTPGFAALAA